MEKKYNILLLFYKMATNPPELELDLKNMLCAYEQSTDDCNIDKEPDGLKMLEMKCVGFEPQPPQIPNEKSDGSHNETLPTDGPIILFVVDYSDDKLSNRTCFMTVNGDVIPFSDERYYWRNSNVRCVCIDDITPPVPAVSAVPAVPAVPVLVSKTGRLLKQRSPYSPPSKNGAVAGGGVAKQR